jgi:hypothetical protein
MNTATTLHDEKAPKLATDMPLPPEKLEKIALLMKDKLGWPYISAADFRLNHKPSFKEWGPVASTEEALFIFWMDAAIGSLPEQTIWRQSQDRKSLIEGTWRAPAELFLPTFRLIASKVESMDAKFFENVASLLRARVKGREFRQVKLKELGIKQTRGRKKTPGDLGYMVEIAVSRILMLRCSSPFSDPQYTISRPFRITREELIYEIKRCQKEAGTNPPPGISESQLGRYITKHGITSYMA